VLCCCPSRLLTTWRWAVFWPTSRFAATSGGGGFRISTALLLIWFPWELPGVSLVEQRFAAVDSRRMVSVWTTIRAMYGTLYAVPEGTATDFPFLRNKEDCRVYGGGKKPPRGLPFFKLG